jgi:hypothetical protein
MNGFHQAVEYESRPTVAFMIDKDFHRHGKHGFVAGCLILAS